MPLNHDLASIVRPIVEGQVKTFLHAHPDGERFPGHMISGLGKRITHDICADQTVERIKLALGPGSVSEAPTSQTPGENVVVREPD